LKFKPEAISNSQEIFEVLPITTRSHQKNFVQAYFIHKSNFFFSRQLGIPSLGQGGLIKRRASGTSSLFWEGEKLQRKIQPPPQFMLSKQLGMPSLVRVWLTQGKSIGKKLLF